MPRRELADVRVPCISLPGTITEPGPSFSVRAAGARAGPGLPPSRLDGARMVCAYCYSSLRVRQYSTQGR